MEKLADDNFKSLYGYRGAIYSSPLGAELKEQMIVNAGQRYNPDWPGDTLRDEALSGAVGYGRVTEFFAGAKKVKTPEAKGVTKWQGTPEENIRLLRTAFRFFGVSDVGAVDVTNNTRKLVFTRSRQTSGFKGGWRWNKWADIDEAFEEKIPEGSKAYIPNKCSQMIVWTVLQPREGTIRYGTLSNAAASRAYQQISVIEGQMQDFLRGIGYQGLQGGTGAIGPSNAWGLLAGVGEMGRAYHVVTSPEFGNNLRGMNRMLTDLPLAPTNPVDAGLMRFCYTCFKCADSCPSDSLNRAKEPSWEQPDAPFAMNPALEEHYDMLKNYKNWPWNVKGIKAWWLDVPTCVMCRNCMGSCPFSKMHDSSIHELVGAIAATTPIFNGFFRQMDDFFGYGLKDPEEFWKLDLPTYGIDTTWGAKPF